MASSVYWSVLGLLLVATTVSSVPIGIVPEMSPQENNGRPEDLGDNLSKQYTGFITVNQTHGSELFYWFFESRSDPARDPLIVWLTGGPGCASQIAVYYETGSYRFNDDGTVRMNPWSWSTVANVLYIDQPVGTGFSSIAKEGQLDYVSDENQVALDMINFLYKFYTKYPKFAERDLYFMGESYAGHYAPAIATRILEANARSDAPMRIPLRGIGIGNGWVNPKIQYKSYIDYARLHKLAPEEGGLNLLEKVYEDCVSLIDSGSKLANKHCSAIPTTILNGHTPRLNQYDIRRNCDVLPLCYDFSPIERLMEREQVRDALGVGTLPWHKCERTVHKMLEMDWVNSFEDVIPHLLENGVRTLIFVGEMDFMCNVLGMDAWLKTLSWGGKNEWDTQPEERFIVDGVNKGTVRETPILSYVKFATAGHMVPMDEPAAALEMVRRFISYDPEGTQVGG